MYSQKEKEQALEVLNFNTEWKAAKLRSVRLYDRKDLEKDLAKEIQAYNIATYFIKLSMKDCVIVKEKEEKIIVKQEYLCPECQTEVWESICPNCGKFLRYPYDVDGEEEEKDEQ